MIYITIVVVLISLASSHAFRINSKNSYNHGYNYNKLKLHMADINVDVSVIGGGIGGTTIAWLLQEQQQLKVALIDPRVNEEATWYPNYGEWRDEWHTLSDRMKLPELKDCKTTEWEFTDSFFGGSFGMSIDQRTTLDRAYVRVDRVKLQKLMRKRFEAANGLKVASKLSAINTSPNLFNKGVTHDSKGTTLSLDNGDTVRSKVVIDASGLESRLVSKESPYLARGSDKSVPTGYQIAYGFIADVDKLGPYNDKAMTLFDYRTEHFSSDTEWLKDAEERPTFMYTMPLGKNADGTYKVFWEETSLVGRGKRRLSFEECKKRAYKRLSHYGISVMAVEEEEYCYIPMGGELPDLSQRIVAFAGAANMVHPATGYHACRMMAASTDLAEVIGKGIKENHHPDKIAIDSYRKLWSKQNRNQRDFQIFGGDFLMQQNVANLRGFFSAFFALEQPVWSGFLAGWPGLPGNENHEKWEKRLGFALGMFLNLPNEVRLRIILYAITFTLQYGPNVLLRSLTPSFLFGDGPPELEWSDSSNVSVGDEEAKQEARKMIKDFKPTKKSVVEVASNSTNAVSFVIPKEEKELALPAPFN